MKKLVFLGLFMAAVSAQAYLPNTPTPSIPPSGSGASTTQPTLMNGVGSQTRSAAIQTIYLVRHQGGLQLKIFATDSSGKNLTCYVDFPSSDAALANLVYQSALAAFRQDSLISCLVRSSGNIENVHLDYGNSSSIFSLGVRP